jgi:hypothetical protein
MGSRAQQHKLGYCQRRRCCDQRSCPAEYSVARFTRWFTRWFQEAKDILFVPHIVHCQTDQPVGELGSPANRIIAGLFMRLRGLNVSPRAPPWQLVIVYSRVEDLLESFASAPSSKITLPLKGLILRSSLTFRFIPPLQRHQDDSDRYPTFAKDEDV